MTVREHPAAPPQTGRGNALSAYSVVRHRFNILQQQKSGEPQLPALFMADFFRRFYGVLFLPFCPVLWRQFSAVRRSSSVSRSM